MPHIENAKVFLTSSKEFLEASDRAAETIVRNDKFVSAGVPSVVCLAFSIELGLKALYMLDHNELKKGHKLDQLYLGLKKGTREQIEERVKLPKYPRYDGVNVKEFIDFLKDHAESFVEWRYACESSKNIVANMGFLRDVASSIHEIAMEAVDAAC